MSNDIIISNRYYKGLREDDIKKHYLQYKDYILRETKDKPIILFLAPKTNLLIVKRNIDGKTIFLTEDNYEQILHGRILSIAAEIGSITNIWFVDIDPGPQVKKNDLWNILKIIVDSFVLKYQMGDAKWNYPRILNTSTGFHIEMMMKERNTVQKIQEDIKEYLQEVFKEYDGVLINERRKRGDETVLDLSSLNRRGARVVPYALNRNGLMCMDITKNWSSFKFSNAKIK
jgi:hypothetical protein